MIKDEQSLIYSTKESKSKRIYFIITYMTLIYGALALRDIVGVAVPMILFSVITVVFALFGSISDIMAITCTLIPLISAVNLGTIVCLLSIVLAIKYVFLMHNRLSALFPLFLLPILFELYHIFTPPFFIDSFLMLSGSYLCVGLLVCCTKIDIDYPLSLKSFILSLLIFSVLLVIVTLKDTGGSLVGLLSSSRRLGLTIDSTDTVAYKISANSNNLGNQCALGICSCIALISGGVWKTRKFLLVASSIVLIGLLTQSRMFFITLLFILLFTVVTFRKMKKRVFSKKITRTIVLMLVLVCLVLIAFPDVLSNLIGRTNAQEVNPYFSRTNIMIGYLQYVFRDVSRVLFGIGTQAQEVKSGYGASTHNMILDVFVSWGLVGLVYGAVFFRKLIKYAGYKKGAPYELLAVFTLLLMTQSGRFFRSTTAIMMLIPVVSYIKIIKNSHKGNEYDSRDINIKKATMNGE